MSIFARPSVVDVGAAVIALGALVVSIIAYQDAHAVSISNARSEVVAYANQMVALDRLADVRNGTQITVLGEQAATVIGRYGSDLELTAATYRVLAQYIDLDTENVGLAKSLAVDAYDKAKNEGNLVEQIRSLRVMADVAAQDGDANNVIANTDAALQLSTDVKQNTVGYVEISNQKDFTGVFAIYSLLWAATNGGGEIACKAAQNYYHSFQGPVDKFAGKTGSLEVSRRAYRIAEDPNHKLCDLDANKELHLDSFDRQWRLRDRSSGG